MDEGVLAMDIEINKELYIKNILSCRKKISQDDIHAAMVGIESFMSERSIRKQGPVITTVYALDDVNGNQVIDLEFLVPVNREFKSEKEYLYKSEFQLQRALCLKFRDQPGLLQKAYSAIHDYMEIRCLKPVTSMYNVYLNNNIDGANPEKTEIDIYLGVQPEERTPR